MSAWVTARKWGRLGSALAIALCLNLTNEADASSDHPLAQPMGRMDDPRNLRTGFRIPDEGYCDQPYIVVTPDGNWLCVMTTGEGVEGELGQHVVATISKDQGRTWSELIDIEPADGPEASWAVPLLTSFGRVYAFYCYNGDRISSVRGQENIRADMLGWYCYRYSDDYGRTWSEERYRLPMRITAADRNNDWKGEVQIFWGIDKPSIVNSSVYFGFTKLGQYMLDLGEGWFYHSDNILTERDPDKIRWEKWPEGDHGLRHDQFGSVQEEHNIVPLSDGSLYCVYRTTAGYSIHAYSRDGTRSWTRPTYMTYRSDVAVSRKIKNPRACPKLFKTANGKYLFWYHNHSGTTFDGRNPAWILGGIEQDGYIRWSEPEILLYDPVIETRFSYPDLIEQDGRYWVSATNKYVARVHEIDPTLLEGLWNQWTTRETTTDGLVASVEPGTPLSTRLQMPRFEDLQTGQGLTIEFWLKLDDLSADQVIFDARDDNGKGLAVTTTPTGTVQLELNDGTTSTRWDTDPRRIRPGNLHHVAFVVDPGPRIITVLVDGRICDGGPDRQHGWGRFPETLGDINGAALARVTPSLNGQVAGLRIYDRFLRNSEVIGNYQSFDALPPRVLTDKPEWTDHVIVQLDSPFEERVIRYTLDGSEPTAESPRFTNAFELREDTVVKARQFWDDGRQMSETATAVFTRTQPRPAVEVSQVAPGVICRHFEQHVQKVPDFATMTPVWTRTVDAFDLPEDVRDIHFALEFQGYIEVPRDGVYTFQTQSDDGTLLWIGDTLIVDNDGVHYTAVESGTIALAAGLHPIRLGYFQEHNLVDLLVSWKGPSLDWEPIPPAALFHATDEP